MKKKRFSVEHITSVLQQVASGVPVGDVCRHVGYLREDLLPLEESVWRHVVQRSTRSQLAVVNRSHRPRRRFTSADALDDLRNWLIREVAM